jgi:hypothetical protein
MLKVFIRGLRRHSVAYPTDGGIKSVVSGCEVDLLVVTANTVDIVGALEEAAGLRPEEWAIIEGPLAELEARIARRYEEAPE